MIQEKQERHGGVECLPPGKGFGCGLEDDALLSSSPSSPLHEVTSCPWLGLPGQQVTINQSLLTPPKIEIDPQFQVVRTQETQQIRVLNNQFASFIDKVRFLEQQNKVLETKWRLLQQQGLSDGPQGLESFFEAYLVRLRTQLEQLQRERGSLDAELKSCQSQEEEYKAKYECEAYRRATLENDFVVLKKDADGVFLSKMEMESKVKDLKEYICFLKHLYEEVRILHGQKRWFA
ncbi:hypothetical protein MG293_003170 [Ovis ammon polii]|uniref:IF rod domain-containing protein n=1 Tax=Ovis ammon polii TaxID=230172 RepID=A0AAD4UMB4_OVIAM|nr:hypothetical protein MG293_003170 [Ovis ammon polii]